MGTIRDIHNPWRDALLPAMFDGKPFYVEAGSRESGRRTVVHEYPKSDDCYSEDMGKRAVEYTVRGYVISFMKDAGLVGPAGSFPLGPPRAQSLYMRDYRIARDLLQQRLDEPSQGVLQLPYMARAAFADTLTLMAICTRYRMTEEDRFGGYAVFDMTFVDFGLQKAPITKPAVTSLMKTASDTYILITQMIAAGPPAPVK
jgi:hypothetical protein